MKVKLFSLISAVLVILMLSHCDDSEKHFLKDRKYREDVNNHFLKRKEIVKNREKELFSVLEKEDVTIKEKEALKFLYAYMPLSDLADYDGDFYLRQVRKAFEAREYFEWGERVPDELFRHFVLVHRVNNEDLDDSRSVFFEELKTRVKGMTMEDAVLEVNHWCHEKITYRATDGRTSAPLALMKTSWGRCGEQSTFTVMALRSVGIPARQCYTPRWVHTDSNHAWVEAWVDGQWRYIGASEPEPELDVAWFTAPAKRAMMVHTNVFGVYNGPEDKTLEADLYSVINVLDTYANTRDISVKVLDSNSPVEGAIVKFEVYNYAQFTPIATLKTDADGSASLKVNAEGDVMVWVKSGEKFAYRKIEQNDNIVAIDLRADLPTGIEDFSMHVPREQSIKEVSKEKIAKNAIRLAYEDSIRNAYMSTFISEGDAKKLAVDNNLDSVRVWALLSKSQGNWKDISGFIVKQKDNSYVLDYLEAITEKDLRDTPEEYLSQHLVLGEAVGIKGGTPKELYAQYIFSPRISVELIRPWREYFQQRLNEVEIKAVQDDPTLLVDYVRNNVKITDSENYYNCPISPKGVYNLRLADRRSRDIFFVAACRSLGIASRLEPATSRPQYYADGQWKDVFFEASINELPKGKIAFTNNESNIIKPAYGTHYTIARFDNGEFNTLNLRSNSDLNDLPGTALDDEFKAISIDAGCYRLTVGSRANDGSVAVEHRYFDVIKGQTITQEIAMPKPEGLIQVQGIVDPNTIVMLDDGNKTTLKTLMNGKGIVLVFSDPDREPTKHILQDLPSVKNALDGWGGGVLFLVPDDKLSAAFDASAFKGLPETTKWATDAERLILNATAEALQIDFSNNFPLVVYLNSNGGILFSSQGYRIGIGENIVQTIEREKQTAR